MKLRDYQAWLGQYGWYLEKAGKDWKLYTADGRLMVRNIIVTHPGKEVIPISIKKTQIALQIEGLV